MATSTVLTVVHSSHENTSTALYHISIHPAHPESHPTYVGSGAFAAETLDLSIAINLVVLENSQLGLLALVLDLLWGSVDLLLALLGSTTQTKDEMKSRLLLDIVVGESAAVLELLAGED